MVTPNKVDKPLIITSPKNSSAIVGSMSGSMLASNVLSRNSSFDQVLNQDSQDPAAGDKRSEARDESHDRESGNQSGSEEGRSSTTLNAVRVQGTKGSGQHGGGGHGGSSGGRDQNSGRGREGTAGIEGSSIDSGGGAPRVAAKGASGTASFDAHLDQLEQLAQHSQMAGGQLSKAQVEQIVSQITQSDVTFDPTRKEVLIKFRQEIFQGRSLQVRLAQSGNGLDINFTGDESLLAQLESQSSELSGALESKGQKISTLTFV